MATDRVTIVSPVGADIERIGPVLQGVGVEVAHGVPSVADLPQPGQHPEREWVLLDRRTHDLSSLVPAQGSGEDRPGEGDPFVPATLEEVERSHVSATLRHTGGNRRHAAHLLGIARSTLQRKVRRYGLDRRFE